MGPKKLYFTFENTGVICKFIFALLNELLYRAVAWYVVLQMGVNITRNYEGFLVNIVIRAVEVCQHYQTQYINQSEIYRQSYSVNYAEKPETRRIFFV